ncbi:MAG: GDSL-type esterase/lipase family protein [Bacteroidales bacterium]
MNKTFFFSLLFVPLFAQSKISIRVAAVGSSITYGVGIQNHEANSYPAQLQKSLGEDYEVRNFGVNSNISLLSVDSSYMQTIEYQASLEYNPNIVLIKLATNEAKNFDRQKFDSLYNQHYQELINVYQKLPSKPRIILMTPTRCYLQEGSFAGADTVYRKYIIPAIEKLAFNNELEVIDIYSVFRKSIDTYLMPDSMHPSASGAARIVEKILPVVTGNIRRNCMAKIVAPSNSTISNFHGYTMYEWDGGYKIVEPHLTSKGGTQWVWRARFWEHKPEIDIALLERGFHIAYCPVENLFGSSKAMKKFNEFYRRMIDAGFSEKVVLLGASHGALTVYNWAAQNTNKVAAIYADTPIMSIKSWSKNHHKDLTEKMMKAYNFNHEKEISLWQENITDYARKLRNIPIIHVVEITDSLAPSSKNTEIFKCAIQKAGGYMTVIMRENSRFPQSFSVSQSVINFLLSATQQVTNGCLIPIPGYEWRTASGWQKGTDWWAQNEEISTIVQKSCEILLFGNSITQGFGGERKRIVKYNGKSQLTKALGDSVRWINAGIAGDKIENLLWRMRNTNYEATNPRHIFITIGVNNCSAGDSSEDIAQGIAAVVQQANTQFPNAKITLFGMLPYKNIQKTKALRTILQNTTFPENVVFVDTWEWFTRTNDVLNLDYYAKDLIHLSPKGYEMWSKKIADIYFRNR